MVNQVDLAHALLTPLTTIKGYVSSLLQSDTACSPELQQEFLKAIDQAADQLNKAIRELLASSQYEPESLSPGFQTVTTMPDLLKNAEAHLSKEQWSRPVKFRCDQDLPPVLASQQHVIQVISHLAHYADEAAVLKSDLSIEAFYSNGQPLICIQVNREGCFANPGSEGYAEPARDSDESQENSLIDDDRRLVICRNILKVHGVTLHAETSPGEAIKFWFTLPAA